jgi:hypothetical protein
MWTPLFRGPDWMPITPKWGSFLGSDAILVRLSSIGADESSLKEIELPATIHLALHKSFNFLGYVFFPFMLAVALKRP